MNLVNKVTDIRGERTKRCLDEKKEVVKVCRPVTPLRFTGEASRHDKKIISLIVIVSSSWPDPV